MFLFGKNIPVASTLSSLILLGTTLVGVMLLGKPVSCGCFGNFVDSKTDEFFLIRNIFFLFVSVFVLKISMQPQK